MSLELCDEEVRNITPEIEVAAGCFRLADECENLGLAVEERVRLGLVAIRESGPEPVPMAEGD
jgi:hypothetical protein